MKKQISIIYPNCKHTSINSV